MKKGTYYGAPYPRSTGPHPDPMGDVRLKQLAEMLRACAQNVIHELKLSPGGDSYGYTGTTGAVDALQEALTAYEEGVEP